MVIPHRRVSVCLDSALASTTGFLATVVPPVAIPLAEGEPAHAVAPVGLIPDFSEDHELIRMPRVDEDVIDVGYPRPVGPDFPANNVSQAFEARLVRAVCDDPEDAPIGVGEFGETVNVWQPFTYTA